MTPRITRRQFVVGAGAAGLGLLVGCGRLPWQAEQATRVPRVGVLRGSSLSVEFSEAFQQGLGELGYVEGRNITIEWHSVMGWDEAAKDRAAEELVRLPVDVIVAGGDPMVRAARQATGTIPIVMALSTDPVDSGLVPGLARPEGNMTGLTNFLTELAGKRLELLTMTRPSIARVAAIGNPGREYQATEMAAAKLGVQVQLFEAGSPDDLERIFEAAAQEHVDAVVVLAGAVTFSHLALIADLAAARQLPAVTEHSGFARVGGLMAYGPNLPSQWRRAAYYVDRILKGAKPADLPVEQPMTFEFVVNLKTARALGITFPDEIMLQVTEVIQCPG